MVYKFKDGARFPVSPQVAGEALEQIRDENGGMVTPPDVVEAARPEGSPLHSCFEWSDERAAELYRHVQARHLINSVIEVRITPEHPDGRPVQAYVNITNENDGRAYMTTAHVMSNAELREQALNDALALLQGVQKRFAHLSELEEVFAAIRRFEAQIERRNQQRRKRQGRKQPQPQV